MSHVTFDRFVMFGDLSALDFAEIPYSERLPLRRQLSLDQNTSLKVCTSHQAASLELSCMKIGSRDWAPHFAKNLKTE